MGKGKTISYARDIEKRLNRGKIPVDVSLIANELGIIVREGDIGKDISGVIFREPSGETIIGINKNERKERQRFTLAHEIGHFVLHREKDLCVTAEKLYRKPESGDIREIEANLFAAELLMPREALESELKHFDSDNIVNEVPSLAKKYRVSKQAMAYRLMNLQLIPIC